MSSLFFSVSDGIPIPAPPRSRSPRRATRPDAYPTVPAYDIPKHMPKHASRPASGRRKPSRNATARPNGNGQPRNRGAQTRTSPSARGRAAPARREDGGSRCRWAAAEPVGRRGGRKKEPMNLPLWTGDLEKERSRKESEPRSLRPPRSRAEPEVRRTTLNSTYDERTN